ncbi:hypothetical protein FHX42_004526 [Saccharopolyspora lacisalsi]|uniref:Uncharacterized protein n=1 Tax=Halosaccharopolyspora lacisalsi TaxID=1000566 RepID=A0A839DYV1_9PSEU|nr:hypothetical protein [Halosaccharopolyspora lacisalsi]MBA8827142.1 hypothetical protein [Halosaccharopolyspora lacisalsi]
MPEHMRAVPFELHGYGGLLDRNAGHFEMIRNHAAETAFDTSGFTGVIVTLIPVVEGVAELCGETLRIARERLVNVREKLAETADDHEERERQLGEMIRRIQDELDGMKV